MPNLQTATIPCPYCGESIEIFVDCSVPRQQYIEDCSVCCRPIVITAETTPDELVSIEGRTEDE
ncbi:CPXCG motif-containing cysteine-rich protein [bacterium]|nr:CPXCG motif-containing cysteine-rich protein [bacterium]PJA74755.1 MAG: CPXCG motif-containing cysteine-rich protein [bacterium CG_4_9_14_3_um_filter_65_15]